MVDAWILQAEINLNLDLPPSIPETIRAVQQFCSGKPPGSVAIPAEIYKYEKSAVSEVFAVTNGVKQGWALAPTLFSLMSFAILMDAYRDGCPGIRSAYRIDGHLLNSRRTKTPTRLSATTVHELLAADDCVLNTMTEVDMQRSMDRLAAGCNIFGLTINTEKTAVMHQPPPYTKYDSHQVTVNDSKLKTEDSFVYLGSPLLRSLNIDDEVTRRLPKASQAFGRM
ncbi:hypothetical protein SprV_0702319200 [Sparganum proliferum]